jgi:hypothetical protein
MMNKEMFKQPVFQIATIVSPALLYELWGARYGIFALHMQINFGSAVTF